MKKGIVNVAFICIVLVIAGTAGANEPSAKATAAVADITLIDGATQIGWTTILENGLKCANGKDIFIDVSLECGLYTATKVDSLGGIEDRAEAETALEIRVLIDGQEALPGVVNFARRSQVLVAEFQGLLTDEDGNVCLSADPNTGVVTIDQNCLRPETLELVLDTMNANSFNFICPDVDVGYHTIAVQAKIDTYVDSTLDTGAKVKDSGDATDDFEIGDTVLTVDREKFDGDDVGKTLIIDDEKMLITAVSGKDLTVTRAQEGTTEELHLDRTRIYVVGGAEAAATLGKGTVTIEEVRCIKDENMEL